ncbi:DUF445 domain-containing protein [Paenibacillus eucommiae]|uniref:Uncharacterized membrane-anchored protein YjiN (DUF445 family) n=1 Tax=Paenibacillus eucommiae TaxID=1355755 RepID=A0ABS4IW30_9BACL|nr:DUF445 domain-containing protein [Paenibacillus eucommiae]MBP1991787.1 uncharacterized membrane-anchored protein YjiN (DUF445 family) [Paenibacillus eucommiae]
MKNMRSKANLSLLMAALLFVVSAVCSYFFPGQWWPRFLLYISEAGLVGALADLFAVTALFRHPLGLKWIPHTAIIPKNRDKLIEGVVIMVEQQLLSKDTLKQQVQHIHLVDTAIRWIEGREGGRKAAEQGWSLLSGMLAKINLAEVSGQLDKQIRKGLQKTNVSLYAGKALKWALDSGDFQNVVGKIVEYAAKRASGLETKLAIRRMLENEKDRYVNKGNKVGGFFRKIGVWLAESTNSLNLDDAVEAFYGDIQVFLIELRSPRHELRVLIEDMIVQLADTLQNRTDVSAAVDAWKNEVIERISLLPSIEALLNNFKQLLQDDSPMKYLAIDKELPSLKQSDVKEWVGRFIQKYWDWFKSDREIKDWLEQYIQEFVRKIIDTEHALIGQIVRKTLDDYTDVKLVEFIESRVTEDLQRIRINGAVVGGFVGACIYGLLYGVYQPILDRLM